MKDRNILLVLTLLAALILSMLCAVQSSSLSSQQGIANTCSNYCLGSGSPAGSSEGVVSSGCDCVVPPCPISGCPKDKCGGHNPRNCKYGDTGCHGSYCQCSASCMNDLSPCGGYKCDGGNASVGGFVVSVDKFGLVAPYLGLASTILVATVATAIYVKRVKRRKEKQ